MHTALCRLPDADRRRLSTLLLARPSVRDTRALREAIALIEQSGAPEFCCRKANQMFERSWARLSILLAPSRAKTMIRVLCTQLLRR
jgi:hypothetical protein